MSFTGLYYLNTFAGLEIPRANVVFNSEISVKNELISLTGGGWFDPWKNDAPFLPELLSYQCDLITETAEELRKKLLLFRALVFERRAYQLERRVYGTYDENQRATAKLVSFGFEQPLYDRVTKVTVNMTFQLLTLWQGQYTTLQTDTESSPLLLQVENPGTVYSPSQLFINIYNSITQFKITIHNFEFTITPSDGIAGNSVLYIDSTKKKITINGVRCFEYQCYDDEEEEEVEQWVDVPDGINNIRFTSVPASNIRVRLMYYPLYA